MKFVPNLRENFIPTLNMHRSSTGKSCILESTNVILFKTYTYVCRKYNIVFKLYIIDFFIEFSKQNMNTHYYGIAFK